MAKEEQEKVMSEHIAISNVDTDSNHFFLRDNDCSLELKNLSLVNLIIEPDKLIAVDAIRHYLAGVDVDAIMDVKITEQIGGEWTYNAHVVIKTKTLGEKQIGNLETLLVNGKNIQDEWNVTSVKVYGDAHKDFRKCTVYINGFRK
jgi:hypothetical protein